MTETDAYLLGVVDLFTTISSIDWKGTILSYNAGGVLFVEQEKTSPVFIPWSSIKMIIRVKQPEAEETLP